MLKFKNMRASLVYKITVSLTVIVVILLAVLILSNIYSLKVVARNMVNASQSETAIYLKDIENKLNGAAKDINEIYLKYLDDIVDYRNKNELDRYFAATQLRDVLSTKVSNSNTEDALFILQPDEDLFLVQFSSRIFTAERMNLSDSLNTTEFYRDSLLNGGWNAVKIEHINYFVKIYRANNIFAGVLIKADSLLTSINRSPLNRVQYVLTDKNGLILSLSDYSSFLKEFGRIPNANPVVENYYNKYFIISRDISGLNGKLSGIIESRSIFWGLELIQWIIIGLGILSIFIIPFIIYYLFREIIKPVHMLIVATKEVEKGNWEYCIPQNKAPVEFTALNDSFSSMVKEIKTLKINTYEEKIERQKAELKYLQMQIRPHFFLNAIATVSSLTYQNKNEEIRKLIDFLSKHLRYMFRGGLVKVPIREETEHVRNYIHMQEIKFPDNIFYMIDIAPDIEDCQLPKFLIQTFVENIFKHALIVGEMLSVFIRAERYYVENEPYIRFIIEDNGDGFPAEIIKVVNGLGENTGNGGKIGIENIKKTLGLLYKREGLLKIGNSEPSGAKVEILIPEEKGEDHAKPARG